MSSDMNAVVTLRPKPLHPLPKSQYGHFIEHLGGCIKGGLWAEGESADMFLGGIRNELVETVRSIHPASIRYPGGCFADGYHWRDGIGPRAGRPTKKNRMWAKLGTKIGPREDNHFGTDEFLQFCEAVGAKPQITVNVGSGTAQEAAEWVEYCNGRTNTLWGSARAKNGHPEPYHVEYWYIGNEIFGLYEIGHQKPEVYVDTIKQYANLMKRVDPTIKIIACGNCFMGGMGRDINRKILTGAGDHFDYLSVHQYVPLMFSPKNLLRYQIAGMHRRDNRKVYYDILATCADMKRFLDDCLEDLSNFAPSDRKIGLCFDEWNLWFSFFSDLYRANYNLRDGLWVATMFNMFHRIAQEMPLASIAQLVNCMGMIQSSEIGTFLTPSALVHRIYTEHAGDTLIESSVQSPSIPHRSSLPVLDVSATRSEKEIVLFMVNRHYELPISVECSFEGLRIEDRLTRIEMHHPNPSQYNEFDDPSAVRISETGENQTVGRNGTECRVSLHLPPHSLGCFKFQISSIAHD